jgi:hypothetical protein
MTHDTSLMGISAGLVYLRERTSLHFPSKQPKYQLTRQTSRLTYHDDRKYAIRANLNDSTLAEYAQSPFLSSQNVRKQLLPTASHNDSPEPMNASPSVSNPPIRRARMNLRSRKKGWVSVLGVRNSSGLPTCPKWHIAHFKPSSCKRLAGLLII